MGLFGLTNKQWGHLLHGMGVGVENLGRTLGRKKEIEETRAYAEEQKLEGREYQEGRTAEGRQYAEDRTAETRKYAEARQAEGRKHAKGEKLEGREYQEGREADKLARQGKADLQKKMQNWNYLAFLYARKEYTPKTPLEKKLLDGILKKAGGAGKEVDPMSTEALLSNWNKMSANERTGYKDFLDYAIDMRQAYQSAGRFEPLARPAQPGYDRGAVMQGISDDIRGAQRFGTPALPQTGHQGLDVLNHFISQSQTAPGPGPGQPGFNAADTMAAVDTEGAIDITPLLNPLYLVDTTQSSEAQHAQELRERMEAREELSEEDRLWLHGWLEMLADQELIPARPDRGASP